MTDPTPDRRRLPEPLAGLAEIAGNLWWTWNADARGLFDRLDPSAAAERRTPAAVLRDVSDDALRAAAGDAGFAAEVARVLGRQRDELGAGEGADDLLAAGGLASAGGPEPLVAYFCCEFGLHESLPLYAGGLGILAGDHLKAASDLALPLVGVGLLYRRGYFRQVLHDGAQTERYPEHDPERLGLSLARNEGGDPVRVSVGLAGEPVAVQAWRLRVGRTPLLLLDTDVEGNSDGARALTGALYGGDRENRVRQEIVLGVGGARMLAALGVAPTVFHMNEGHSAFLAIERLRTLTADGHDLAEALETVRASTVFTTHTPVPAGNEVFDRELVRAQLGDVAAELGADEEEVLGLGRLGGSPDVGMTVLALRTADHANGVSALHGEVSRVMWRRLWPGAGADEVPIGSVTNGVHPATWLSPELRSALEARGARPGAARAEQRWEAVAELSDEELWRLHGERRAALVAATGLPLDPDALTIGFSRRFATYKRAGLLFRDPARLARIVASHDRPVQVLLAGKAHPADAAGKELIATVARAAGAPALRGRVAVLENYDMGMARLLVAGVDVWLNTPLRPQEASGTSGMKAAMNGVLNLSILDGWWCEGYDGETGWAIVAAEGEDGDGEGRDAAEAQALYRLLEDAVVPLFHAREAGGPPAGWVAMMRAAIARIGAEFSAQRMVEDYRERLYLPAHRAGAALAGRTSARRP